MLVKKASLILSNKKGLNLEHNKKDQSLRPFQATSKALYNQIQISETIWIKSGDTIDCESTLKLFMKYPPVPALASECHKLSSYRRFVIFAY